MLTQREIEKYIHVGRRGEIICLDSTVSTNLAAAQMAADGAADGTVIVADGQTGGMGRLGRSFYSPARAGIYLSYIKELPQHAGNLSLLTSLAGLAVCDAIISACGLSPQIKWPNDIIIAGKKVCGILTKLITDIKTNRITHAIIGIGINVNQCEGDFPEELAEKAGSLRMALGQDLNRTKLCAEIINRLDTLFFEENALYADTAPYVSRLREVSCVLGKKVTVSPPEGEETVLALDIASDGGLVVLTDSGKKVIHSGEIVAD